MQPREFLAQFRGQFGGGLIPFDTAYLDSLAAGATPIDAIEQGCTALLEAFVAQYEAVEVGDSVEWVDERGIPVEGSL